MAITNIEYALLKRLKDSDLLPENPSLLELGQSNWYGDVSLDRLVADVREHIVPDSHAEHLISQLTSLSETQPGNWLFAVADIFWEAMLGPHEYVAIDLDGIDERAHKFDLNEPVPLDECYDIVCNFGTAEHVFNVYQVFKTVHELTKPGGLMLHGLPFQGWVDHGFYNFQPTFFFDLAAANSYAPTIYLYAETSPPKVVSVKDRSTILEMAERGEIGPNAMLYTALRKPDTDQPFKPPVQGYYARSLDAETAKRWSSLR